ncbi:MAG: EutN/CcmL family microcompartment protein [Bacteriovoracia bacterium]
MQYAVVRGTVVATQKVDTLKGVALKVLVPCDRKREALGGASGDPIVAIDGVGAREGDLVMWVGKREASMALSGAPVANMYPVDAAVTGIIDDIS